jgi:sugar/nucleoside kinase (ribokinase family)
MDAGDALIGSFPRYLAGGLSLDAALIQATRYSAFSVTRHGAEILRDRGRLVAIGASRN